MNFLEPWGLLGLAALAPVIALYFLKLKREHRVVPSTLLWKKVIDDLQVNSPFQRLKYSLLLLMQLLLIGLLGFAMARPYLSLTGYSGQKLVLLIDTSASMSTRDAGPNGTLTRLEAALRDAGNKADDLRQNDEMMIVAFDRDVRQLTSKFTHDRSELRRILANLQTRDLVTRADEAFETALALTESEKNVKVLVLSDGCFGNLKMAEVRDQKVTGNTEDRADSSPLQKLSQRLSNFRFISYGDTASDNVGITQIDARTRPVRATDQDGKRIDALETQVFVMVENFSQKTHDVVLSLSTSSQHFPPKVITLKGRPPRTETLTGTPAEGITAEESRSVEVFKLPLGTTGIVSAHIDSPKDKFPVDDTAYVYVGSSGGVKLLLVTKGNYFLEKAFSAMRGITVTAMTPDDFLKLWDQKAQQATEAYDACVFDEVAPLAWPEGGALFFGAMPPLPGFIKADKPLKGPDVVDWDVSHPAMRYVNFGNVDVVEAQSWQIPKTAKMLVEGPGVPLIAAVENDRTRVVAVAFSIFSSNWVLRPSLPLFLRNVIPWIAEASPRRHPTAQQTGEPLVLTPVPGASSAMLIKPDGSTPERIELSQERSTFVKGTTKAGLYTFKGLPGEDEGRVYAVNLASRSESDNAAQEAIQVGDSTLANAPSAIEAKREIWRDLALAAGALLLLEWWVYHRRVGM